jgi:hypothetical protein
LSGLYDWLWIGWIVVFGVVEGFALHDDMPGHTLSEHVRKWFSVKTKLGRTVFLVVFGGFVAWFSVHILTGTV